MSSSNNAAQVSENATSSKKRPRQESESVTISDDLGLTRGVRDAFESHIENYKQHIEKCKLANRDIVAAQTPQVLPFRNQVRGWSMTYEVEATRTWTGSKKDWSTQNPSCYLSLYKTARQHVACTPWDIVGARNNLVFENALKKGRDYQSYEVSWSSWFCSRLCCLIVHPAWTTSTRPAEGRADLLAAAIQYTIIRRTGDDRPWLSATNNSFVRKVQSLTQSGLPIREAHAQVRKPFLQADEGYHLYHISNVLSSIEDCVTPPGEAVQMDKNALYRVKTEDLVCLIQALDRPKHPQSGASYNSELLYKTSLCIRIHRDGPSREELSELHAKTMREEVQRSILRRRLLEIGSTHTVATYTSAPYAVVPDDLSEPEPDNLSGSGDLKEETTSSDSSDDESEESELEGCSEIEHIKKEEMSS